MGYLGHLGPFWLYGFSVGSMYEMIIEDEYDPKIKNQFCVIDSCCFSDSAKLRWKRAIRSFNFISKVSFQLRLLNFKVKVYLHIEIFHQTGLIKN